MPSGSYLHLDADGQTVAVEEFSCAAGPVGWRYTASVRDADGTPTARLDLVLDAGGRQVRVELSAGGWLLRGGVAGREVLWVRGPVQPAVEHAEVAAGFTGRSPAFFVATARLLRLSPGARARTRLVELSEPALGTRVVEQGWSLVQLTSLSTDLEPLPLARYDVADLDTGQVHTVYLAGDVVVGAPGIELAALHSPPTL